MAYESAAAGYENGLVMPLDVCQASLTLCEAEERCLFADVDGARSRHLARVTRLERIRVDAFRNIHTKEGRDANSEQLRRIGEYRAAAAAKLRGAGAD